MFRACPPGKDPRYALSDPGCEYLEGLTEVWFGKLARRWGVEGQRATLEQRENLYKHRTVDGKTDLLPHVSLDRYRPVHGGVYHANKELDALAASQTPEIRKRIERAFALAAKETTEEYVLPYLESRLGKGGTERVRAETVATLHIHKANAAGFYHLHAHLEVHNVGRTPDGKYRCIDNNSMFVRQAVINMVFQTKLSLTLHRELGIDARPSRTGLVIKGYESMQDVRTPRQEQIDNELKREGIPSTPASRDVAARKTRKAKDPNLTVPDLLRASWEWMKSRGVRFGDPRRDPAPETSALNELRRAEDVVRKTVQLVSAVGRHTSFGDFSSMAEYGAVREGVDQRALRQVLTEVKAKPGRYGMRYATPELLTTNRIERSRAKWGRTLLRTRESKATPPSELAVHKARSLNASVPAETVHETLLALPYRTLKASHVNSAVKLIHDAYASDERRRVFFVASELGPKDVRRLNTAPVDPDSLARRVKLTSLADTFFFELRKHRLRSPHHAAAVAEHLRKPKLKFTSRDLVIVDTRNASHHAVATVVAKAKKAKASLIVITKEPVIDRARGRVRDHSPQL